MMKFDIDGKLYTDMELHKKALDLFDDLKASEAEAAELRAQLHELGISHALVTEASKKRQAQIDELIRISDRLREQIATLTQERETAYIEVARLNRIIAQSVINSIRGES